MKYMLGTNDNNGNVNYNYLPSQTPDELSPLLWWATPNLIAIDRNLLNGGLETMYAILQRGACQRSYGTQGGSCPRTNTAANQLSMISLSREGLTVAYVCLGLQLLVSIGAMAVYIPWIM